MGASSESWKSSAKKSAALRKGATSSYSVSKAPAGGRYVTETIGDKTYTSFVPKDTVIYSGKKSEGASVIVDTTKRNLVDSSGKVVGTVENTPTPPAAIEERKRLIEEASSRGERISDKQLNDYYAREQQAQISRQYAAPVKNYDGTTTYEIPVSPGFAERYNSEVLQQSRYDGESPTIIYTRTETDNSKARSIFIPQGKREKGLELSERGKKVVAFGEKISELERENQKKQAEFSKNSRQISNYYFGEKVGPYVSAGINLGYGASIGFGQSLSSAAAKTFFFTGALITPELKDSAKSEIKRAYGELPGTMRTAFNPRTAEGQVNIAALGLAVIGKAQSIKASRAKNALRVEGEKLPPDKVINQFAKLDRKIAAGKLKNSDVTFSQSKTTPRLFDQKGAAELGDSYTSIDYAKPFKSGESSVLTETQSVTTPSAGKTTTNSLNAPRGKVNFDFSGRDNLQIVTTTVKGSGLYNYQRVTIAEEGSAVNIYARIGKFSGTSEYLGATKANPNLYSLRLVGTSKVKPSGMNRAGTSAYAADYETSVETFRASENPYLKIEVQTTKATQTSVNSRFGKGLLSTDSGAVKTPYAQGGSRVTDYFNNNVVAASSLEKPIYVLTKGESTPQVQNIFISSAEPSSVETVTPYVAEVKTSATFSQLTRITYGGKRGSTPNLIPFQNLIPKVNTVQIQKPTVNFNMPKVNILNPSSKTVLSSASGFVFVPQINTGSTVKNSPDVINLNLYDFKSEIVPGNRNIFLPGEETNTGSGEKLRPFLNTNSNNESDLNLNLRQNPFVDSNSVQDQRQEQEQAQRPISDVRPSEIFKPRQKPGIGFSDYLRSGREIILPKIPSLTGKNGSGFDVFVKRRGAFYKQNKKPLSRSQALALGTYRVESTSAATFKVLPSKRSGLGNYKGPSGSLSNFYTKGGLFIEKNSKRINTSGELREITYSAKSLFKRGASSSSFTFGKTAHTSRLNKGLFKKLTGRRS